MSLPPGPLASLSPEDVIALLCRVIAAYTGAHPSDPQVRIDASQIAAVAEKGFGLVRLEWDRHFLRAVKIETSSIYSNPQQRMPPP